MRIGEDEAQRLRRDTLDWGGGRGTKDKSLRITHSPESANSEETEGQGGRETERRKRALNLKSELKGEILPNPREERRRRGLTLRQDLGPPGASFTNNLSQIEGRNFLIETRG